MRSESMCVSLENGRATATMAIRMPMLSYRRPDHSTEKTPAHAGVGWLEAVPGVEHGDKGLAGPTP